MMLGLPEQVAILDEVVDDVFDFLIDEMQDRKAEIIELARSRMIDGFEEYGDEMWTWDDERRDREFMEELADAIVYRVSEHD